MDGMEVLQKVGGFDLAAMAGAFLGGAIYPVPVVIDFGALLQDLIGYKAPNGFPLSELRRQLLEELHRQRRTICWQPMYRRNRRLSGCLI